VGRNNVIELNGKTYDATTGALLGESIIRATPAARKNRNPHHGRVIDGFVRKRQGTVTAPTTTVKPVPAAAVKMATPKAHSKTASAGKSFDMRRSPKAAAHAHAPEKPKTLMRHVVQKPKVQMKPAIKTTAPSEMMARPASDIAKPLEKKLSVTQVNPFRLARSRQINKSHHIRRFGRQETAATTSTARQLHGSSRAPEWPIQRAAVAARQDIQLIKQVPAARPLAANAQVTAQPKVQESAADIFEAALAHATSHEQAAPIRRQSARRRRLVNVMAGVGAFLLIGGFIGYLNMTNIELRVASMRAGFHAQMPSYKPAGYAMNGGIESGEGRIAMSFRSGDSAYTVTQEASDWNSATLLDQTSIEEGQPSQTIQSKGRTIYIYDDSNATWVNGGVRYKISGNAALDADQLVALATSM
jgi:hypothetical protein